MTTPRLRAALDGVPAYRRGGPAGPGHGPKYNLSSNENPYPPLPGVLDAVAAAAAELNRYPDMFATGLVSALAGHLGVTPAEVVVGPGSVGVLTQIVQAAAGDGDEVVYAWRSFEAYPIVVRLAGATPVPVPLTAGARHDLPAMAAAVTGRTRLLIVCTPNNPTGPAVGVDDLDRLLADVPPDLLVVVDEAYREFTDARSDPGSDLVARYRDRDNVVMLRTFSKAYGLAGLRVGFAVARPVVADELRKTALPFGVSGLAQAAAIASLQAEPALLERVAALTGERSRVLAGLRSQGWPIPDAQANFIWFPLGAAAESFAAECAAAGLSVRPFAGDGVRVTVGETEANDRLLELAAKLAPEFGSASAG